MELNPQAPLTGRAAVEALATYSALAGTTFNARRVRVAILRGPAGRARVRAAAVLARLRGVLSTGRPRTALSPRRTRSARQRPVRAALAASPGRPARRLAEAA